MPRSDAAEFPVGTAGFRTGCPMSRPIRLEPSRRLRKSPGGNPARLMMPSMATAQPQALEACLRTMPFPAISAGAAARNTCQKGKFQGMMASRIPSGSKAT